MNRLAPLMAIHAEKQPTFVSRLRYWALLLLTVGLLQATTAQAQTINTLAGNGTTTYNGEDENGTDDKATAVSLSSPRKAAPAVSATGDLYIADSSHNRIRRVDKYGIITTVAGNGTAGFSGDGGLATSASLNYPTSVAIDSKNNLYIVDNQNHRIRKVTASNGFISTVAGTGEAGYNGDNIAATTAQLNTPVSVAIDSTGTTLYIVDKNNQRIRKVDKDGYITTVAGTGEAGYYGDGGLATAAHLNFPFDVAVDTIDTSGNFFIADTTNQLIRKVTGGIISTMAGNGGKAFAGDGGLATEASLNNPAGIEVAANGDLYIADTTNQRIRQVRVSDGIINTVVGNGTKTFGGDGGAPINASLNNPYGVTIDTEGNLYIADTNNQRVRKVTVPPVVMVTLKNYTYPTTYGSTVNIGASVSATSSSWTGNYYPDGTVAFKDGSTDIAGCSNVAVNSEDDSGICAANGLSVGSHSLTGVYTPSSSSADLFGSATSVPLVLTVNKADTTTALKSSAEPIVYGSSVTFTATVTGVGPTGTVKFYDYSYSPYYPYPTSTPIPNCDAVSMSNGIARCTTSSLSIGTHSITASYSGDANNASSNNNNAELTQTVHSTGTSIVASPTSSTYGNTVTFTATVTGSSPTGTVTFNDQIYPSTLSGCSAQTLSSAKATCKISSLSGGSHRVTATYNGDANNASSTSASVDVTINKANTTTSLSGEATFVYNTPTTFTATVTGVTTGVKPTGTVSFKDTSTGLTVCMNTPLSSAATATCDMGSVDTLGAGTHYYTATYNGDGNYSSVVSPSVMVTITPVSYTTATTVTNVSSDDNPSTPSYIGFIARIRGAPVVNPPLPGTVTFKDGGTIIKGCDKVATTPNYSSDYIYAYCYTGDGKSTTLSYGSHSITATFNGYTSGNSQYLPSISSAYTQVVQWWVW